MGGRDDTVASRPCCELSQTVDLLLDGRRKSNLLQVGVAEAGDDGERQNLESRIRRRCRDRSLENGAAAGGVHRNHTRAKLARGADGSGCGVWYFMELQVKKNLFAHGNQFSNNGRALCSEKLQANFVEVRLSAKLPNQFHGLGLCLEIEGDDYR